MDILSDYRITAIAPSQRLLAERAEWARIALERAENAAPATSAASARTQPATGSLACVPVSH
ncbi:MAG TPA: hypothetical protein VGO65_08800 [Pseudolysinimonas sp.]|jgi:hypothetical protein|nr:hypothetical protein [Schumannella sp.]HEV7742506.1 hypothetical protein [Pseudolysinimonas sp.]